MPKANLLWQGKHNINSSKSLSNSLSRRPVYESDLMLNQNDLEKANALSSHNIFGLIQNDGMTL